MKSSPYFILRSSSIFYFDASFFSGVILSYSSTAVNESSNIARKRLRSIQFPMKTALTKYTAIIAYDAVDE